MNVVTVNHSEALDEFIDESLDSLFGLEGQLELHRKNSANAEAINGVFRAIHSLKGCAAFLDLDAIRAFSHSLENTLDAVREGTISLSEELQAALLDGFDVLGAMLEDARRGEVSTELGSREKELLGRIEQLARTSPAEKKREDLFLENLLQMAEMGCDGKVSVLKMWAEDLRKEVFSYVDNEPLGSEKSQLDATQPTPSDFLDVRCVCHGKDVTDYVASMLPLFLGYQEGQRDKKAEAAFLEAAQTLANWAKEAGQGDLEESLRTAAGDFNAILGSPIGLDENLLSFIWDHLWPRFEELKVEPEAAADSPGKAAGAGQQPPAPAAGKPDTKTRFVRVNEERLEEFLDHVSRLFITSELLKDVHSRMATTGKLAAMVEELQRINADLKAESTALQHGVMALRRVSVSGLFSKFPKMARTLASDLGKKITVHVTGEQTEIDKTLAEDLDAPLTHLIRNVVDHGIELPERRKARGVSETGNLWLQAELTRNHVRITVRDDGGGIDPRRLRDKAVEKGLLTQATADAMTDEDALNLIFHAGFSTAKQLSDVSGRGVGLDVVRTAVADHGGLVTVQSKVGGGTTFCLEIPIRQATLVIDGLMVSQDDQQFVIPFDHVKEITEVDAKAFASTHGRRMVTIRDRVCDAIALGEILDTGPEKSAEDSKKATQPAVLLVGEQAVFCLLVDRIVGHRQVVVTDLKDVLSGVEKFLGVAQLGGGRLALVLNVPELVAGLERPGQAHADA